MKRILKWSSIIVAIPIGLLLLLSILLYVPFVQDFAVRKLTEYASSETGMNISIDRLRLHFLVDLDLQGLVVTDAEGDTLVAASNAVVDLTFKDILQRRIGVEGVSLNDANLNTKDLIATASIRGRLEQFSLYDDIDLLEQHIQIDAVTARGLDVDITLQDTTVVDTTESTPLNWTAAIAKATIEDAHVRFAMPGDSAMTALAAVQQLAAQDIQLDLGKQLYQVEEATLSAQRAELWMLGEPVEPGTALPIALDSITLTATGIRFDGEQGHLSLPAIALQTPSSKLTAAVDMDFDAFVAGEEGSLEVSVKTIFSKEDILKAGGDMLPAHFGKAYPDKPLHLILTAVGNMSHLTLTQAEATLPGSIYAEAGGDVENLLDSVGMKGNVAFNLRTQDINWVQRLAGNALDGILLPPMQLNGTAHADGTRYKIEAQAREGRGVINLIGSINTQGNMTYGADMHIRQFSPRHFLPQLAMGPLSATISAQGNGTDIFSHDTRITAKADMQQLSYDSLDLSGLTMQAQLANGIGHVRLNANNPKFLVAQADIDARLTKNKQARQRGVASQLCDLTFSLDLSRADLQALGLSDQPLRTSMRMHMDGHTDLNRHHQVIGSINDIALMTSDSIFHPEDITLEALLTPDTTYATLSSGDLSLRLRGHTGYDQLSVQLGHFMDELNQQLERRHIDEEALARKLPQVDLRFSAGQQNPAHDILHAMGYGFEDIRFGMNLDPLIGMNGGGHIYKLNTGAILLDTIQAHVYQDSTSMRMDARVRNGRHHPQVTFDGRLNASLDRNGIAAANLTYFDDKGRKGVDLGLQGSISNDTLQLHLTPLNPIIAYRTFQMNADNFVRLTKHNHIDAELDLRADDGTGLRLYTSPVDENTLQNITVSIDHLNLGELSSVLPYLPQLGGFLHGDAHLIQAENELSVSTDLEIDDFRYENAPIGQIGLQAVYLPNTDGSHFVDGTVLQAGTSVANFNGTYTPDGADGRIDVNAVLDRLPFSLANAFIPDGMVRLEGVAIGDIHVGGTTATPLVNGALSTEGLRILSDTYSLQLRVADDTLRIHDSILDLDRIAIYSTGKSPFTMDGTINFANADRITLDAIMSAKNFELINAKKTTKAVAYGKAFVDFNASARGTLDNLNIRGDLRLLGNTDVTYVLTDSPLTADDQLADLVEFVDFSDSLYVEPTDTQRPQHINVSMNIGIDEAAQVHCLLSTDGSNYVNLEGGGDFVMTYSPDKDLQLNGRYTINNGSLKYTMMVIPLKEFTIKSGSYAEFRGPLMNPTLSLSATERVRTTITENNQPRSVNFDVGLNISQTLQNLGLEFTLDAPDDMNIQNDLSTMSAEQRGRLAVTMLATGMYINDAGALTSGGVTGQNALNAFLQSQVSNITNKALKSIDISMGVEQGTSSTGTTTTDYSFRFAKRFWGNRISVIVGGKVSTGQDATNTGESIIDNVSIEYRLDQGASRYVNVFYDKNYESLLDGEVTEMGAGLVLRRKTQRLGELFLFRKKE